MNKMARGCGKLLPICNKWGSKRAAPGAGAPGAMSMPSTAALTA